MKSLRVVGQIVLGAVILTGLSGPPAKAASENPFKWENPAGPASRTPATAGAATGSVIIDLAHGPSSEFLPDQAFGAALDGQQRGDVERIYTPENIAKMRTAGLRSISYSLRTELEDEAWHWSEQGSWSDPGRQQGYWVSSDKLDQNVLISHGYHLPRRGNTFDQAENQGYSRLTDGDETTFWKSNPYLDRHYTGEDNARYPQWLVLDLGAPEPIDAIRIDWALPYAKRFEVQFWVGDPADFDESNGQWHTFVNGRVADGDGSSKVLRLVGTAVDVRFVRILLLDGSGTAPAGSTDIRDSLGFAINEIFLGYIDDTGALQDELRHAVNGAAQSVVYTSSTDPWHRAVDRDLDTEQPGFDLLFGSGLNRDLPILMSVPILYDTPENVAAEIRFLKARGYPLHQLSLGEEPDGQVVSVEHAAALYLQFADAIHKVDPTLVLGGPSFQGGIVYQDFDVKPNTSWVERFMTYLREHHRLSDYRFLSFEWYPFVDYCSRTSEQLKQAPEMLKHAIDIFHEQGIPASMPMLMTEYGFTAFAGRPLVDLPGALIDADIVGQFLAYGGKATFFYGYEPSTPFNDRVVCGGDGQLMLLEADAEGHALWPMPTYFATKLLSEQWAEPINRTHQMFPATSTIRDDAGREVVTAYAVLRPDGQMAVLLLNKDPDRTFQTQIRFTGSKPAEHFAGELSVFQYSPKQYAWHVDKDLDNEHPIRDDPPRQYAIRDDQAPVTLPPYSLTVIRGAVPFGPVKVAGREPFRLHLQ